MNNICKKFGINIKKYRIGIGYSQEKLADITGLHRTYISSIERGHRSISLNNIAKLADALNVDIHELFVFDK